MFRILLLVATLSAMVIGLSCAGSNTSVGSTPTDAYKFLYAAVKTKDIETIKKQLSRKTIEFGTAAAARSNTTIEKMFENGFTATTFSASLPTIRDERIKDSMASIEVWNSEKSIWEDLPFVIEDGGWKLAIGELFAGSFKSPGKGRDEKEKEAANLMTQPAARPAVNANANAKAPTVTDIPLGSPNSKK